LPAAAARSLDRPNRAYAVGLARAFAGAIIFSLPLLMTMEMWWFGFSLDRGRLLVFALANFVVLIGLSRVAGFEETHSRLEDVLDAFAAYAVAVFASAGILLLLGVIDAGMPAGEIAGKIAVQAVPASFGAMIADKTLGAEEDVEDKDRWRTTYPGQLFLMLAGALFLSFNVAPTEEMVLIAYQMTPWHAFALVLLSILLLDVLVYSVGFSGQQDRGERGFIAILMHYSLAGYAIAVAVSLFVLWTFGRTDGVDLPHIAMMTAVLGFPGAIGAAIARLVV
jgi:putative integral membrane protein (TIGR02587 family)